MSEVSSHWISSFTLTKGILIVSGYKVCLSAGFSDAGFIRTNELKIVHSVENICRGNAVGVDEVGICTGSVIGLSTTVVSQWNLAQGENAHCDR